MFKEISSTDQGVLLCRIDFLPYDEGGDQRRVYRTYGEYLDQMLSLHEICRAYEVLSNCIRSKAIKGQRSSIAMLTKDIAEFREKKLLVSSLNNS